MKEICRSIIKTSITEEHEEFTINVFFSPLELFDDYKVTIAPLGNETIVNDFCTDMHFSGLLVNQLSEFFVVTITNLITSNKFEKVILIPCEIPFEKRDTAIINEIVKTKDDFYRYLSLILDESAISSSNEEYGMKEKGIFSSGENSTLISVYERLLENSVNIKKLSNKLKEIEYISSRVKRPEVISEEFTNMIEQFKSIVPKGDGIQ